MATTKVGMKKKNKDTKVDMKELVKKSKEKIVRSEPKEDTPQVTNPPATLSFTPLSFTITDIENMAVNWVTRDATGLRDRDNTTYLKVLLEAGEVGMCLTTRNCLRTLAQLSLIGDVSDSVKKTVAYMAPLSYKCNRTVVLYKHTTSCSYVCSALNALLSNHLITGDKNQDWQRLALTKDNLVELFPHVCFVLSLLEEYDLGHFSMSGIRTRFNAYMSFVLRTYNEDTSAKAARALKVQADNWSFFLRGDLKGSRYCSIMDTHQESRTIENRVSAFPDALWPMLFDHPTLTIEDDN